MKELEFLQYLIPPKQNHAGLGLDSYAIYSAPAVHQLCRVTDMENFGLSGDLFTGTCKSDEVYSIII